MSNKIKNIVIIIQSVLLLIIVIFGFIYFGPKLSDKMDSLKWSDQYLSLNDNISDLEFYDIDGNISTLSGKYKLIIYLSKDCSSCTSHIPIIKRINETFAKEQNLELMLFWINDSLEYDLLEYYGFANNSFILNDIHISNSYNTLFLVDEYNNIIYTVQSGYESMLDKIIELNILDKEKLIHNSNEYIKNNLTKNYSEKPDLIYFSMPGCPDCADANQYVYSDIITDKLHMTRIELVNGAEQYDIKDEYNVFRKIYSIDWYPSFLVIENDGNWGIVRKVELDELQKSILSIIE